MPFEASIILDSISSAGVRLTTFQLRYPRFIHAELMTHRVFSRNASSSRAIPVKKMIQDIIREPAEPVFWGSNKPGMQAGEELTGRDLMDAKNYWRDAMWGAIIQAQKLVNLGLHKQIANRLLEPYGHINVVVTSTEFQNFFTLRCHETAQPEIKVLADLMLELYRTNEPQRLESGEWHLPYVQLKDRLELSAGDENEGLKLLKAISVARCARVSYLTHDGRQTSITEDLELYDRLVGSQPLHASPAEHQATPDEGVQHGFKTSWMYPEQHGNLRGWRQLRKMLPGEYVAG
jgi:hypothetical protein